MGKTIDMMGAIKLDAFGAGLDVVRFKSGVQVESDSDYRERIRAALVEREQAEYFSKLKSAQSAMVNLTLRDYFAAKAMQGALSAASGEKFADALRERSRITGKSVAEVLAIDAYITADAMIAERVK